jgi:hypothetical protein
MSTTTRSIVETLECRTLRSAAPVNFDLDRNGEINMDDMWVVDSHNIPGNEYSGWAEGNVNGDNTVDSLDQDAMFAAIEAFNAPGADTSSSLLKLGDANGDGEITEVDMFDFDSNGEYDGYDAAMRKLEEELGYSTRPGTWAEGDFNGDGMVDKTDVTIFNAAFKIEHGETISGDELFEIDSIRATLSEIDAEALNYQEPVARDDR